MLAVSFSPSRHKPIPIPGVFPRGPQLSPEKEVLFAGLPPVSGAISCLGVLAVEASTLKKCAGGRGQHTLQ
jgi:hypothetical protein